MMNNFEDIFLNVAKKYRNVVALGVDGSERLGVEKFRDAFPDRYFAFGNGAQNVVGASMGFLLRGKLPFIFANACDISAEAAGEIRDLIAFPNSNVKLIAANAGLGFAQKGGDLQTVNDIAVLGSMPNMKVLCPADEVELESMLEAVMLDYGPTYLRLDGGAQVYKQNCDFEFGKVDGFGENGETVIFASGKMVYRALQLAREFAEQGVKIGVGNVSTIKPLDERGMLKLLKDKKRVITLEEHSVIGGMGDVIGNMILKNGLNVHFLKIGIEDKFGEAAGIEDLERKFGLDENSLKTAIKSFIESA